MADQEKPPVADQPASDSAGQPDEARVSRRRALLGAISAAGVTGATQLPQQWARPVVDNVILPAHAQLSPAGTQSVSCDVVCTSGIELHYESVISYSGTVDFVVSEYQFTACVAQNEGGDASRTSIFNSTFGVTGSLTDPGTFASFFCTSGPFTPTGICEEPIG
ncbi:MAG TPA: hypothetical protein VK973_17935 [Arenicellales bacterium]|nr:hypothetical protein [Arenicellales bacterium]